MPEVTRSVIVGHTPRQMFDLVDAVERYPEFLPWCEGASVIRRDGEVTLAALRINYHGIRHGFTTENARRDPEEIRIRLVEGPFRVLDGTWRFFPLADRGCKIEFRLHYEFSSRLLARALGPVFDYIANSLVQGFVKRAEQLYGWPR